MWISLDLNGSKIHAIYLEFLKRVAWWHDAMQEMTWCNAKDAMRWDAWHEQNAKQKTKTQPRRKITYRISGKGKSRSYEYGTLYPGRYTSPPRLIYFLSPYDWTNKLTKIVSVSDYPVYVFVPPCMMGTLDLHSIDLWPSYEMMIVSYEG